MHLKSTLDAFRACIHLFWKDCQKHLSMFQKLLTRYHYYISMNSLLLQLMEFQTAWISALFHVLVALLFLVMLTLREVALDLVMKKNPCILIQCIYFHYLNIRKRLRLTWMAAYLTTSNESQRWLFPKINHLQNKNEKSTCKMARGGNMKACNNTTHCDIERKLYLHYTLFL